jgi:L-fucose isomerase-like protein
MMIQVFQKVKKKKAYKNIPIIDENGKVRPSQNLDEFCKVKLGKSYRRLQELSGNMEMLGTDLYESAERIGFRAKDYRALKALPPEEQEVVKTALASDSKDEVVDILQDMAARHQAEKEAAKKEVDDLTADLDARGKLLKDKAEKLEQTEEELYRLKSLPKDANLELKLAREEEATNELNKAFVTALGAFNEMLMQVDAITENEDVSNHTKAYGFDQVRAFCIDVQAALGNYGIPVDFEEMVNPAWMREEAKAGLEEG